MHCNDFIVSSAYIFCEYTNENALIHKGGLGGPATPSPPLDFNPPTPAGPGGGVKQFQGGKC